jgi:FkbM family methyltransferase
MWSLNRIFNKVETILNTLQGKGWGGATTEQEVRFILSKLPSPEIVVDVGGNIGNWTAALLNRSKPKHVYVFEPSKRNQGILAERFRQNKNVVIIPKALSDKDGAAPLFANESGSGLASLHQRRLDHFGIPHEEVERIEMMSVSQFISDFGIPKIDILTLDIEGHELTALKGIPRNFWDKINVIQFEFGGCNIDSRTFFQDFWYLLSPRFTMFRMSPMGLLVITQYRELDEVFATTNYLCLHRTFKDPIYPPMIFHPAKGASVSC